MRASELRHLASSCRTKTGGTVPKPASPRATTRRIAALLLIGLLIAAACSSKKSGSSAGGSVGASSSDTATPVEGGSVVYAQEAEDAGGLCLPEAQLDISGINYARTIYDTLTMPNDKGEFVPVPRQVGHPERRRHGVDDRAASRHQVPRRHRRSTPTSSRTTSTPTAVPTRHGIPILFALVFGPYIKVGRRGRPAARST